MTRFKNEPNQRTAGFVQMPNKVLLDNNLSSNEKILYVIVIRLSGQRGYCFASNSYIAKVMDVSISSIEKRIKKLKELKYITADYIKQSGKNAIVQRFLTANITVGGNSNELTDPRLEEDYEEFAKEFKDDL